MDEDDVAAEVALLTDAAADPALSEDDLELLVRKARRADGAGRAPSDSAWEGAWDVAAAVALGWELKAGRAAGRFEFASGEQRFLRQQVRAHCLEQARQWRRRVQATVSLRGAYARVTDPAECGEL